jgi:hypothetical protein
LAPVCQLLPCGRAHLPPPLDVIGAFAFFQQHGDHLVDLDAFGAFLNDDLADRAFIDGFDFHGRLVGLDLGDDVAELTCRLP